jgi:hypothetical protein
METPEMPQLIDANGIGWAEGNRFASTIVARERLDPTR